MQFKPHFPLTKFAGWLAVTMMLCQLLSVLSLVNITLVTLLGWLTLFAMWPSLRKSAQRQSIIMFCLGVLGIGYAYTQQQSIDWLNVFARNVPLMSMFVAISFLSLTNIPDTEEQLPRGDRAIALTSLGTNVLGAVINLSVVFVFGDRLKRNGTLSDGQLKVLARCFSLAAWWSPFFIATGVAIIYAPGMDWKSTMLPGVIMAILGMIYTFFDVRSADKDTFYGYPIKLESLVIPVCLAISVLLVHQLLPTVSMVVLISVLSLIGAFVFMKQRPRRATLKEFIDNKLLTAGTQFALFLAAGVFSSGISALLALWPNLIDLNEYVFDTTLFALCSGAMIFVGILGVHPVISIAIVSPLLLPLEPNSTSLGFMFLTTWAIATGSSPLSGTGLVMSGRYAASSRQILRNNWHYAIIMWLLACGLNELMFHTLK